MFRKNRRGRTVVSDFPLRGVCRHNYKLVLATAIFDIKIYSWRCSKCGDYYMESRRSFGGEVAVKHHYQLVGVIYNPFQGRKYQFECKVCGMRYNIPTDAFWGRIW